MHSTHIFRAAFLGTLIVGSVACSAGRGGGAHEASPPSPISTFSIPNANTGASTAGQAPASAPTAAARFRGADFKLEALGLGQKIGDFENVYYETVCDTDSIEHQTRSVWFHAAKPCREAKPLPGGTVLVIYTTYTSAKNPYDKVEAIAWFGDWPSLAGNFPLKVGVSLGEAERTLGTAKKLFESDDTGKHITVYQHAGGTFTITRNESVVGYCIGAFGSDPNKEEWRGLLANVGRYHPL